MGTLTILAVTADLARMFDWKDSYSVHVQSIDGQHQNLFRMAGELHRAMSAGDSKLVLAKLLDKLVDYTAVHFAHEERLMQSAKYPDFAAHKAAHDELTRQVLKFQEDFKAGRIAIGISLLQFLKSWLEKHIQETDKKYTPYLQAKVA
jgi:hemerythrin